MVTSEMNNYRSTTLELLNFRHLELFRQPHFRIERHMGVIHVVPRDLDLVKLLSQHLKVLLDLVQFFLLWVNGLG